jgi:regulator of sirC expression with transglutaminase-like and TPR domain
MTAFAEVAAGRGTQLIEAALEIAAEEYPDLSIRDELAKVERLCQQLRRLAGSHADQPADDFGRIALLNRFFFDQCGFRGASKAYYNPRNSYLNDVLERRIGIPITLSVIYAELAVVVGLELHGVNLPGHFVLGAYRIDGSRLFIDVFHGGTVLDWNGCRQRVPQALRNRAAMQESDFPPMSPRETLARMLRNLKGIYLENDLERATRIQRRLAELLPHDWEIGSGLADLYSKTGRPGLALQTLKSWLRRRPDLESNDEFRDSLRRAARDSALAN